MKFVYFFRAKKVESAFDRLEILNFTPKVKMTAAAWRDLSDPLALSNVPNDKIALATGSVCKTCDDKYI